MLREFLLALFLLLGAALITFGVSTWSLGAAAIVAGLVIIAAGVLFLTEVGD